MAALSTILVVDDDADFREVCCEVLTMAGYHTIEVSNGEEALAYLRASPAPALIVLDLMMPIMNGYQFRAAQRQDPRIANIPVVIVSATSGTDTRLDGATVLSKLSDIDHLTETVRALLR